jgi:hypothetical protein
MQEPPSLMNMLRVSEGQLRLSLDEARARFAHAGNKGDEVERAASQFLREHLPRRYGVGEGEIIDTHGKRSGQLDVVVSDELQPFSFPEGSPGLYLIEGVVGTCEIKSVLTTDELEDVIKKAKQFKPLKKSQVKGELAIGKNPATDRFYHRPPFFALAFDNTVRPQTIVDRLSAVADDDEAPNGGPDALFVLGQGFALNLGDGTDVYQFRTVNGDPITGWVWCPSETVLADLLLWFATTEHRTFRPTSPIVPYISQSLGLRGFVLPSK